VRPGGQVAIRPVRLSKDDSDQALDTSDSTVEEGPQNCCATLRRYSHNWQLNAGNTAVTSVSVPLPQYSVA
jgi:hypothetical protein